jgi:hypothetical protein
MSFRTPSGQMGIDCDWWGWPDLNRRPLPGNSRLAVPTGFSKTAPELRHPRSGSANPCLLSGARRHTCLDYSPTYARGIKLTCKNKNICVTIMVARGIRVLDFCLKLLFSTRKITWIFSSGGRGRRKRNLYSMKTWTARSTMSNYP